VATAPLALRYPGVFARRSDLAVTALFEPVVEDLARVERIIADSARVDSAAVSGLLGHVVSTRGKRLRPALACLAAGFHEHSPENVARLAAAIELLHMATLVHDDLVDGAETRRGSATIHALFDPRAAVLVGDFLFAKSAALCTSTGSLRVMNIFAGGLLAICDGELRQGYGGLGWRVSRDEYLRRITAKTAELFRVATEAGGIISGAEEAEIAALRRYGLGIGIAFQIVDDVLDFVGDQRELGKPVGGDLRQGILTLPALWYLDNHPEDRSVAEYLSMPDEADGAAAALVTTTERIASSEGIAYSLATAREYCEQAKLELRFLPGGRHREALMGIADYVTARHV
jgi:geranylgeranyl pyrophosphate synthase